MIYLKILLRDFYFHKFQIVTILFVMSLGFFAVLTHLTLDDSSQLFIDKKAKEILTADFALRSHVEMDPKIVQEFEQSVKIKKKSVYYDFFSMVRSKETSLLASVIAVDENYPLIGTILDKNKNSVRVTDNKALIYPEIAAQLQLSVGQFLFIGDSQFQVSAIIQKDAGLNAQGMTQAPKIYISHTYAKRTQLIKFGSHIHYRNFYIGLSNLKKNDAIIKKIEKSAMSYVSPELSVFGLERTIQFVRQFLGILTYLTILLSFLSGFYFIQHFIQSRISWFSIAQLQSSNSYATQILVFLSAFFICLFAVSLAILAMFLIISLENNFQIARYFIEDFEIHLSLKSALLTFALATIVAFLQFLPISYRVQNFKLKQLIDQSNPELPQLSLVQSFVPLIASLLFFFVLSSWFLDSFLFGLLLQLFLIIGILILFFVVPHINLKLSTLAPNFALRFAFLNASRKKFSTLLMGLTLVFMTLLTSFIPSFYESIQNELGTPEEKDRPAFFVINIQPEIVKDFQLFVKKKSAQIKYISPMIQGRLQKINNKTPDNERFRKFPVRLSYRKTLIESERLIRGKPFSSYKPGDIAQVSIESQYAKRNNFQLGDRLSFDIQGLPIEAIVQNFRKVKWTSFHPNFFIQFQDGVLNEFPQNYVGVLFDIPDAIKNNFQFDLAKKFPGLSIIDVNRTLKRVSDLTNKVSFPVLIATLTCLFVTLGLLGLLALFSQKQRRFESDLFRLFSREKSDVIKIYSLEFLIHFFWSSVIGAGFGFGAIWFITRFMLFIDASLAIHQFLLFYGLCLTVCLALVFCVEKLRKNIRL